MIIRMEKVLQKGSAIVNLLFAIIILAAGVLGWFYLKNNGPQADKKAPEKIVPVVRVIKVKAETEQLYIETQGRVTPGRQTQAASEIMGRVTSVSPKFKVGGSFDEGEIMLEIDGSDYVAVLATCEANLADAHLALATEQARADQSASDWKKLGRGVASDLVLRKPQIVSAKAQIVAAEAAVDKAIRDLDRTKLRAPYLCRIEATYTDLGSYVTPGARLADLYSSDSLDVRVPLTLEDFAYLNEESIVGSEVLISATVGNVNQEWSGKVTRSEELVDSSTMTVYLVVGIEANEEFPHHSLPLSGLFVQAKIKGKEVESLVTIPRSSLRSDNTVLVLNADDKLEVVSVSVFRTQAKTVLISSGLSDGIKVITSPIETAILGMQLREELEPVSE